MGLDALFRIGGQAFIHQILLDVVEDDGRTRPCQGVGNGEADADAVGCAGDQGHLRPV